MVLQVDVVPVTFLLDLGSNIGSSVSSCPTHWCARPWLLCSRTLGYISNSWSRSSFFKVTSELKQFKGTAFQWLLAHFACDVSALLDDQDHDHDDESSSGAGEADGPALSLPPATALTLTSLESIIPVNTLIMAEPGCRSPRPLTVQVSVEAVVWTWLTLTGNPAGEQRSTRWRQSDRGNHRWEEREDKKKKRRASPPRILWLIKCYYPAQQEVPEK